MVYDATAKFISKDPLASHHTHSGHGGMMAVANIADGRIAFCYFIRCGLRLATGRMILRRASAIRLYVCKTRKGPIDMNLAVISDWCGTHVKSAIPETRRILFAG